MDLKYLVTGTGRSGTVYMARFLTSVGIPCGHETIFDWRGLEWAKNRLIDNAKLELSYVSKATRLLDKQWVDLPAWINDISKIEADSSYMAAPFLNESFIENTKIIHVVRNPIKVINSFCNYIHYFTSSSPSNHYEELIYEYVPELKISMPIYDRACLFWVRWNQFVEKCSPDLLFRIEDTPQRLMEFLGKNGSFFQDTSINTLRINVDEKFLIDKIKSKEIKQEFIDTGKRYGYSMISDYLFV